MFRLCLPYPWMDLLTSGSLLLFITLWLVSRKARQSEEDVDGNQRLMIRLTFLAILADISLLIFVIAWRAC